MNGSAVPFHSLGLSIAIGTETDPRPSAGTRKRACSEATVSRMGVTTVAVTLSKRSRRPSMRTTASSSARSRDTLF